MDSPQQTIEASCPQYIKDMWENQKYYVEVWVEKEALSDVVWQDISNDWEELYNRYS